MIFLSQKAVRLLQFYKFCDIIKLPHNLISISSFAEVYLRVFFIILIKMQALFFMQVYDAMESCVAAIGVMRFLCVTPVTHFFIFRTTPEVHG